MLFVDETGSLFTKKMKVAKLFFPEKCRFYARSHKQQNPPCLRMKKEAVVFFHENPNPSHLTESARGVITTI